MDNFLVIVSDSQLNVELVDALKRQSKRFELLLLFDPNEAKHLTTHVLDSSHLIYHTTDPMDVMAMAELMENFKLVLHTGLTEPMTVDPQEDLLYKNALVTEQIVDRAIESGVERIIYLSSANILKNKSNTSTIDEDSEFHHNSNSDLISSLYLAEQHIWRAWAEGVDVIILNAGLILHNEGFFNGSLIQSLHHANPGMPTAGSNAFLLSEDLINIITECIESKVHNQRFLVFSENINFEMLFTKLWKKNGLDSVNKWNPLKFLFKKMMWAFLGLIGNRRDIDSELFEILQQKRVFSNRKCIEQFKTDFKPILQTLIQEA